MATAITNGRPKNQLMRLSADDHVASGGYDYNLFVTKVQDYCVSKEIHVPRWRRATPEDRMAFHANVLRAMKQLGLQVAEEHRQDVASELSQRIIGMGVPPPWLMESCFKRQCLPNWLATTSARIWKALIASRVAASST